MSPKRLGIFLTLVVSWPFWLLLRSRFGEHFFVLLFLAWGFGYLTVWSLMQPEAMLSWQTIPELDALHELLPLLSGFYRDSIAVWGLQLAFVFFQRFGVFLGECAPPQRWYSGCFWVCRYNYAVPDIIGATFIWFSLAGILSNRVPALEKTAPFVAGAVAAGFILMAYVCFLNGHNLPFRPPAGRGAGKRRPIRYLARLRSQAARSREGLGHIFSRRDPALMRISRK